MKALPRCGTSLSGIAGGREWSSSARAWAAHEHGWRPLAHTATTADPVTCSVLAAIALGHPQEDFQSELVRKIQDLYKYDCLRANKATMAWGVEARVPFLDKVGWLAVMDWLLD
jgi:hypothetical protein